MLFKSHRFAKCLLAGAAFLAAAHAGANGAEVPLGKQPARRLAVLCEAAVSQGESLQARADADTCLAFIDGFVWGHAWAAWREAKSMWFCLPDDFLPLEGARAVVGYVSAHPERIAEESRLVVFLALTAAYPCGPDVRAPNG